MPINQIPGSTPTQAITYTAACAGADYSAFSDAGPIPISLDTSIEAWPFTSTNEDNSVNGTVTVTHGSASVVGSGSNFTSQLQAGDKVCFMTPASPPTSNILYTILSITDDTSLTLTTTFGETTQASAEIYGPFNRPPTCLQIPATDSRANILIRDESSGDLSTIWEVWYPTYDPSTGWRAAGGFKFDLTTGAQRQDGFTSSCTGGTPCSPFLVRYEEANSGTIDHPLRGVIHTDLGLTNGCIWPCIHAAAAFGGVDYTKGNIPTGAVLRLNSTWLATNIGSFPTSVHPVLTAANVYGLHVNDYTEGCVRRIRRDLCQDLIIFLLLEQIVLEMWC